MRAIFVILSVILVCGCTDLVAKKVPLCENKTEQYEKDACYMEFAVIGNDLDVCNSIQSQNNKMMCMGIIMKDTGKCDEIKASNDSVQACYAYALRDPSYCDKIQSKTSKTGCYALSLLLNDDASACARFSMVDYRDRCLLKNARLINDTALCGEIQNQTIKQSCEKISNHSA